MKCTDNNSWEEARCEPRPSTLSVGGDLYCKSEKDGVKCMKLPANNSPLFSESPDGVQKERRV